MLHCVYIVIGAKTVEYKAFSRLFFSIYYINTLLQTIFIWYWFMHHNRRTLNVIPLNIILIWLNVQSQFVLALALVSHYTSRIYTTIARIYRAFHACSVNFFLREIKPNRTTEQKQQNDKNAPTNLLNNRDRNNKSTKDNKWRFKCVKERVNESRTWKIQIEIVPVDERSVSVVIQWYERFFFVKLCTNCVHKSIWLDRDRAREREFTATTSTSISHLICVYLFKIIIAIRKFNALIIWHSFNLLLRSYK